MINICCCNDSCFFSLSELKVLWYLCLIICFSLVPRFKKLFFCVCDPFLFFQLESGLGDYINYLLLQNKQHEILGFLNNNHYYYVVNNLGWLGWVVWGYLSCLGSLMQPKSSDSLKGAGESLRCLVLERLSNPEFYSMWLL